VPYRASTLHEWTVRWRVYCWTVDDDGLCYDSLDERTMRRGDTILMYSYDACDCLRVCLPNMVTKPSLSQRRRSSVKGHPYLPMLGPARTLFEQIRPYHEL